MTPCSDEDDDVYSIGDLPMAKIKKIRHGNHNPIEITEVQSIAEEDEEEKQQVRSETSLKKARHPQ